MRPKRLGELSVREEADRCISCSAETSLERVDGVDGSRVMSCCRSSGGRLFQIRGPAAVHSLLRRQL